MCKYELMLICVTIRNLIITAVLLLCVIIGLIVVPTPTQQSRPVYTAITPPDDINIARIDLGAVRTTIFTLGSYVDDDKTVIMLHGFPDTALSYVPMMRTLHAQGYYCVAPVLRGYEPSSLSSSYRLNDVSADIIGIMDMIGMQSVHVIGHDWGATVVYRMIAQHPQRFRSANTIAIPARGLEPRALEQNLKQIRNFWYMIFFQLRYVSEWYVERKNYAFIDNLWRDWSPGWPPPSDCVRSAKIAFSQPGVLRAAMSYYRHLLKVVAFDRVPGGRALLSPSERQELEDVRVSGEAITNVPTQAIHGLDDGCVDRSSYFKEDAAWRFPNGYRLKSIRGTGHFVHLEAPRVVNALIIEWITRYSDGHNANDDDDNVFVATEGGDVVGSADDSDDNTPLVDDMIVANVSLKNDAKASGSLESDGPRIQHVNDDDEYDGIGDNDGDDSVVASGGNAVGSLIEDDGDTNTAANEEIRRVEHDDDDGEDNEETVVTDASEQPQEHDDDVDDAVVGSAGDRSSASRERLSADGDDDVKDDTHAAAAIPGDDGDTADDDDVKDDTHAAAAIPGDDGDTADDDDVKDDTHAAAAIPGDDGDTADDDDVKDDTHAAAAIPGDDGDTADGDDDVKDDTHAAAAIPGDDGDTADDDDDVKDDTHAAAAIPDDGDTADDDDDVLPAVINAKEASTAAAADDGENGGNGVNELLATTKHDDNDSGGSDDTATPLNADDSDHMPPAVTSELGGTGVKDGITATVDDSDNVGLPAITSDTTTDKTGVDGGDEAIHDHPQATDASDRANRTHDHIADDGSSSGDDNVLRSLTGERVGGATTILDDRDEIRPILGVNTNPTLDTSSTTVTKTRTISSSLLDDGDASAPATVVVDGNNDDGGGDGANDGSSGGGGGGGGSSLLNGLLDDSKSPDNSRDGSDVVSTNQKTTGTSNDNDDDESSERTNEIVEENATDTGATDISSTDGAADGDDIPAAADSSADGGTTTAGDEHVTVAGVPDGNDDTVTAGDAALETPPDATDTSDSNSDDDDLGTGGAIRNEDDDDEDDDYDDDDDYDAFG